ncbi:hypothetical protein EVAR_101082_1 [Eumeta japonica]|uniref:Uncharacterized protein n=1 Tax=Eumeta variegata TaxID=151549 RepID=A0A4C2ACJ6_EUMVA|nr:hypothetical protein EVAR_101082_1 [Eumeta japonica]
MLAEYLLDDEPIDIVQLPQNLDELTDCEDIDDDILEDHDVLKEVSREVEFQYTTRTNNEEKVLSMHKSPPKKKSQTSSTLQLQNSF